MMSGTIKTWMMKNLGITAVPGKLPPKTKKARYVPTSGIDSMME